MIDGHSRYHNTIQSFIQDILLPANHDTTAFFSSLYLPDSGVISVLIVFLKDSAMGVGHFAGRPASKARRRRSLLLCNGTATAAKAIDLATPLP